MKSRKLKITLLFICFLIFIAYGVLRFFSTEIIIGYIAKKYSLNIATGKIKTNIFNQLEIKNLVITSEIPILKAKYIKINYNLFSLLKKELLLTRVVADGLDLSIKKKNDRWNVPVFNDTTHKNRAGEFTVIIKKLSLGNSNLNLEDYAVPLNASFHNINISSIYETLSRRYLAHVYVEKAAITHEKEYKLTDIRAAFDLSDNKLFLTSLQLFLDSQQLIMAGKIELFPRLHIDARVNAMAQLHQLVSCATGTAAIKANIKGNIDKFAITGDLKIDRAAVGRLIFSGANCNFRLDKKQLLLSNINIKCNQGIISGDAELNFKAGQRMNLTIKKMNVNSLLSSLYAQKSLLGGELNGILKISSTNFAINSVSAMANFELVKATYKDSVMPPLSCVISLKHGDFKLIYQQHKSTVFARGVINNNLTTRTSFNANYSSIGPFLSLFNLKNIDGNFTIAGDIEGKVSKPRINAHFKLSDARYDSIEIGYMKGDILFAENRLLLKQVEFNAATTNIQQIASSLKMPQLSGKIVYNGLLNGYLEAPQLTSRLCWYHGRINSFNFDSLFVAVVFDSQKIHINNGIVYNNTLSLPFSGLLDLNEKIRFDFAFFAHQEMKINGVILENKNIDAGVYCKKINLEFCSKFLYNQKSFSGNGSFYMKIKGTVKKPLLSFSSKLFNFSTPFVNLDEIALNVDYCDDVFRVYNSYVEYDNNRCTFTGEIPFKWQIPPIIKDAATREIQFKISGENLSLNFLTPFQKKYKAQQSQLDLDLFLSGALKDPRVHGVINYKFADIKSSHQNVGNGVVMLEINGSLKNPQFNLDWAFHEIARGKFCVDDFKGKIEYYDSTLVLKEATISIEDKISKFSGAIPCKISLLPPNWQVIEQPLHLKSRVTDFNLTFLKELIPLTDEIIGKLNYNLEISGTIKEPIINGLVDIDNAGLKFSNIKPSISNIKVNLSFNQQEVWLDSLTAQLGDGELKINGKARLGKKIDLEQFHLECVFQDISITYNDLFSAEIDSGFIVFKGENYLYDLTGFVNFEKFIYTQDITPQFLLNLAHKANRPTKSFPGWPGRIHTNLTFRVDNNLWVYNNIAKIKMGADLTWLGTLEKSKIAGQVILLQGYFLYLDRKFEIEHGILDFTDPDRINPAIDMQAITYIRSYENIDEKKYVITLKLSGNLEYPEVSLISDPPLSQSEIIAVLTVGRTREELLVNGMTSIKESFKDVLLERAKSITSRTITNIAEKQVGTLLNLDNIVIEGDLFNFQSEKKPRVIARKKLTRELDLTYSTVVGHANDQMIKIGYKLSKNVSIEGETDQQGRAGIDLKFKFKFK